MVEEDGGSLLSSKTPDDWMSRKKPKKRPNRGSGVSVTLPTEPLAGAAKDAPIMAVMVQDDGVPILEYELKVGNSIQFRVGWKTKKRSWSGSGQHRTATYSWTRTHPTSSRSRSSTSHALSGPQRVSLGPGQRLTTQSGESRGAG